MARGVDDFRASYTGPLDVRKRLAFAMQKYFNLLIKIVRGNLAPKAQSGWSEIASELRVPKRLQKEQV